MNMAKVSQRMMLRLLSGTGRLLIKVMQVLSINLGYMYANGEGVPENYIRAYVWWSMAKTQGNTTAAGNLDILKPKMTPQQIADGQALAAKCYESGYKECD